MDDKAALQYIGSLLYTWLYRPSVDVSSREYVLKLKAAYGDDDFASLVKAVEWAVLHSDYPFASIFQGVTASDSEIHTYFVQLLDTVRYVNDDKG